MQLAFACVLALAPASTPGPTPPRYSLAWSAPQECPDAAAASRSIDATLGDETTSEIAGVSADARIVHDGQRYRLTLRIAEGERVIEGDSCEELAETAAFIVAIALDPRVLERGAPAVEPEPSPEVVPEPEPRVDQGTLAADAARTDAPRDGTATRTDERPSPARPPRRRFPFTLGGRGHVGVGIGPSPAATAVLGLGLAALGRWSRYEIEGAWWAPSRIDSRRNPDVGLVGQLWHVGVRGCGVPGRGRVDVPLCALVQAGMVHARGRGDFRAGRASQAWVGIGGGVMVVVRILPRLAAVVAADLLWGAVRGGFRSEPSGDIDRVGAIAFSATAGLQWRLSVMEPRGAGQDRR